MRFGLSLRALGDELSWNEAWDLTSALILDPTSHSYAAIAGWAYPPSAEAVASLDYFERWINARRGKNEIPKRVPRPWMEKRAVVPDPAKPDETRIARRSRLADHLGLGSDEAVE